MYEQDTPDIQPPHTAETDPQAEARDLEELTLAELVSQFLHAPRSTWRALTQVLSAHSTVRPQVYAPVPLPAPAAEPDEHAPSPDRAAERLRVDRMAMRLVLYLLAFGLAWWGGTVMVSSPIRVESVGLAAGLPWLLAGFLLWCGAEIHSYRDNILRWWQRRDMLARLHLLAYLLPALLVLNGIRILIDSFEAPPEVVLVVVGSALLSLVVGVVVWLLIDAGFWMLRRAQADLPSLTGDELLAETEASPQPPRPTAAGASVWWMQIHPARIFMLLVAVALSWITWMGTTGNLFATLDLLFFRISIFWFWIASVAMWALVFAPAGWLPLPWLQKQWSRLHGLDWRAHRYTLLALLAIMLLGAFFRLHAFTEVPPEMTSDHVEKLLDANRVLNGVHQIFFANNGGREPFQMYAMALFSQLPGQGINFSSLKLLAVVESLLTLPVLFWLGVEIVGRHNRKLGILVGLLLAALVAASYWHVAISRLSLRIVLTPLVTSLLMIYLARGLRYNRRSDFIKAGLVLGFGLYTYQAVRMLPVVVVVAVGAALLFSARTWQVRWRYVANLAVLVLISFAAFLPLFHYSVENPEHFWRRTTGRLLGDDIMQEVRPDGTIVYRDATLIERVESFNRNLPQLTRNIRNALLMFNWKGDIAWINGYPNHPAMDPLSGALLVVGLAAWIGFSLRHRDLAVALVPVVLFIMLLPSALSIAFPNENPSATRTSGALPAAYLIAALPMSLIVLHLRWLRPQAGRLAAAGFCALLLLGSYAANSSVYFERYRDSYIASSLPYSEAGRVLQSFALSDGTYGNAFMIAYPFWWDHRAVGLEGGVPDWPNGIERLEQVPQFLYDATQRSGRYRLDVNRDLLFFYSREDEVTAQQLRQWFPAGRAMLYPTYQLGDEFMVYRVPWLGITGFEAFLTENGLP